MRIAHVAPRGVHPYSGLLTALVRVSVALAARGLDVEVWQLSSWNEAETGELIDALAAAGIDRVSVPPETTVDLVHVHGVFGPANNALVRRVDVPIVISPHGGYAPPSLEYHRFRKMVFKYVRELPMLRRARLVCALTRTEAEEIRSFGVRAPIVVIPNGAERPDPGIASQVFRAELAVESDASLALYTGRLDVRAKRLDDVVRGVAAAPGWHLALMGGDYRDGKAELEALIAALGVGDRVHLPAPRRGRRLDEALAAADLFVLMSRSEGSPMALLEALAAGTPALVSSEVDQRVGISAAGAGWVALPDEIGERFRRIPEAGSAEWRERSAAASLFAERHEWSLIAAMYEAAYAEVLSTPVG